MWVLVAVLGCGAGVLTTVAGLGGGMVLLLALSVVLSPAQALTATAPALLVGNLHRLAMFRKDLQVSVASHFALGALPGAVLGGLCVAHVPEGVVRLAMLVLMMLAVFRAVGLLTFTPSARWLVPAGAGVGVVTAGGGGAGVLAAPLLLGAGLRGHAYVATGACCAVVMHAGRLLAYGASGLMNSSAWGCAAVLAVSIPIGNALGRYVRTHVTEVTMHRVEVGAMVLGTTLAVWGLAG